MYLPAAVRPRTSHLEKSVACKCGLALLGKRGCRHARIGSRFRLLTIQYLHGPDRGSRALL
jgi:hypothetical protein